MDIKKIEYFLEVAKKRGYTAAARDLSVSQPMLSKVIQQIEEELGAKLIDRSSRKFELTGEGAQFHARAVKLIDEYYNLISLFSDKRNLMSGEVRLAIPAVISSLYLPKFLMGFRDKYPEIRINIFEEGSKGCLRSVLADDAHLGVVMLPITARGLEITHLTEDRCVLAASTRHRLAGQQKVKLGELRREDFILFNSRFVLNEQVRQACESAGFTPQVVYQSSLDSFIMNMVALNQGVTVLPRPLVNTYKLPEICQLELEPGIPWKIALIVKEDRYRSHAVQGFIDELKEFFGAR